MSSKQQHRGCGLKSSHTSDAEPSRFLFPVVSCDCRVGSSARSAQPGEADRNGVGLGRGGPMSAGMGGMGMAGMMGGGRGRGGMPKGVKAFKGRGGA